MRSAPARGLAGLGIVVVMLASCSDDPSSAQGAEHGSYVLIQINNQNLPFSLTPNQGAAVVEAGSLDLTGGLAGGSTYAARLDGMRNNEFVTLFTDAGMYARTGSSVSFHSSIVPTLSSQGTVSGSNVVTVSIPGVAVGTTGTVNLRFQK